MIIVPTAYQIKRSGATQRTGVTDIIEFKINKKSKLAELIVRIQDRWWSFKILGQ